MKKLICLATAIILTACTYSVNLVHTAGTASDVVDETQAPKTDVKADATLSKVP